MSDKKASNQNNTPNNNSNDLGQVVNQVLQQKNLKFYPIHGSVATIQQYATALKKSQLETVDITTRSNFTKDADFVFGDLREWVYQSLDQYHREFLSVAWPLFVIIYLELVEKQERERGKKTNFERDLFGVHM